jgi:hypothetical protein
LSNAVAFAIGTTSGPTLTSLFPTFVWAGFVGPRPLLAVNGTGFVSGAHIFLGVQEKAGTTYVGPLQLTAPLLAADIASPGTIMVSVTNPPAPGVPSANALPLAVQAETTDPTVTIGGADSGWHNTAVPLTFAGSDSQSGVQSVQYRCPPAVSAWTTGSTYTVPVTTQGAIIVSARATDWCARAGSASATVKIDTTRPTTDARNAVRVKRGKVAMLKYIVTEPALLSPSARVVLRVKAVKGGKTVKTIRVPSVAINAKQVARVKATFKKGRYRWYVYATDLAGNTQANVDKAAFTVK